MNEQRTCEDCRFALFHDNGWSSWTVEGCDFFCMINEHPDDGFDSWYKEDKRLEFGSKCSKFIAGDCVEMDVERGNISALSPEQRILFDTWAAS